jgi:hypothetical protein
MSTYGDGADYEDSFDTTIISVFEEGVMVHYVSLETTMSKILMLGFAVDKIGSPRIVVCLGRSFSMTAMETLATARN